MVQQACRFLKKIGGKKCPLQMEQHHHAFFRIALVPSDGVPGQMILVECVQITYPQYHTYIVFQGSPSTSTTTKYHSEWIANVGYTRRLYVCAYRGDVEGVLAVGAQGGDGSRFGDTEIGGCVPKMTIMI